MSTTTIRQTFWTGGQIDQINWKRTDINDYMTMAQSLINCEVGTTGLIKKRKGTKFLLTLNGEAISTSQLYEFADQYQNYYIFMSVAGAFFIYSIVNGVVAPYPAPASPLSGLPYQAADLPNIDYALTNDSLVLTHPLYPPARIYVSSYSGLPPLPTFAYQVIPINPIPPFDFGLINYSQFAVSASVTSGILTFQFTGLGGDPGFTSAWVGGLITGIGASVTSPLGSAIITDVGYSGGTVTFHAIVTNQFAPNGSLPIIGSQWLVQQPAWSSDLGYPAKCLFYQNRLWLANTPSLPATIFGSKINQPANFDAGVGLDTDAIVYTIGQTDAGGIIWMNGGKQLEIYTANFEFAAPQEQNIGLTPGTFSVRLQSSYGSTTEMKPLTYFNDSYFVTRSGNALMNYHFDGIGQTYNSSNISALSEGLIGNPINRALLRGSSSTQDNFIYFVNTNNTITTFQFAYAAKLAALTQTQFQLDSNGNPTVQILDIVSVNNIIYFLKYYPTPGQYALETFSDNVWLDGWTMNQSGTNTPLNLQSSGLVTGLSQFNGLNVDAVYQNQDFGVSMQMINGNLVPAPVMGGQAYFYNPNGLTGNITVGYMYPWYARTMYLFAGANESNYYKQITRMFIDYYHTLGLYINGTLVNYQNYADIMAGLPLQYQTGTAIIDSFRGWDRFSTIELSQNVPFDCQVTAIAYQIDAAIV